MRIELFDDWLSLAHLVLGAIAYILYFILFLFIAYEMYEFILKPEERRRQFIGDLCEFALGYMIGGYIFTVFLMLIL